MTWYLISSSSALKYDSGVTLVNTVITFGEGKTLITFKLKQTEI